MGQFLGQIVHNVFWQSLCCKNSTQFENKIDSLILTGNRTIVKYSNNQIIQCTPNTHFWRIKHWALVQSIQIQKYSLLGYQTLGTSTKYSNTHYWGIKHWVKYKKYSNIYQSLLGYQTLGTSTKYSNTGHQYKVFKYSLLGYQTLGMSTQYSNTNYRGIKHWVK